MTRQLVFIDTETNGLDPRVHDAWDVAWWNLTTGDRGQFFPQLPDGDIRRFLAASDVAALKVGRFLDRWDPVACLGRGPTSNEMFALAGHLWGPDVDGSERSVIVGANPSFDWAFLTKLAVRVEVDLERHHRMIDLGSYVAGVIGHDPAEPLSAARAAEAMNVPPGDHTAEGDVTSGGRTFLAARLLRAHSPAGAKLTAEKLEAVMVFGGNVR